MALRQVFSEYFGFPCQLAFHRLLHIHHILSSGTGTIGQLVADVPSGLSLTPPQETKKELTTLKSYKLSLRLRSRDQYMYSLFISTIRTTCSAHAISVKCLKNIHI
jgi:hypothetical protein